MIIILQASPPEKYRESQDRHTNGEQDTDTANNNPLKYSLLQIFSLPPSVANILA